MNTINLMTGIMMMMITIMMIAAPMMIRSEMRNGKGEQGVG